MNRRGFLKGMLAIGAAPYVVTTAGVLMPLGNPLFRGSIGRIDGIILHGDGIHDDTAALQAMIDGKVVKWQGVDWASGPDRTVLVPTGSFKVTAPLVISGGSVDFQGSFIKSEHVGPVLRVEGDGSDVANARLSGCAFGNAVEVKA